MCNTGGGAGKNYLHIHKDGHKPVVKGCLKSLAPCLATIKTQKETGEKNQRKRIEKIRKYLHYHPSNDNRRYSKIRKCTTFTEMSRYMKLFLFDERSIRLWVFTLERRQLREDIKGSFKIMSDTESMNRNRLLCISRLVSHLCNYQASGLKWIKINTFSHSNQLQCESHCNRTSWRQKVEKDFKRIRQLPGRQVHQWPHNMMAQMQPPSHAVYKSPITTCKECLLGKVYSKNPTVNSFPKYQGQDPGLDRLLVPPNKAVLECYARENTTCTAYKFYKLKITNVCIK